VYGDSKSNGKSRKKISECIAEKKPDIVLITGDVVTNGNNYEDWGRDFFEPANKLFANTPVYIAIGNHEKNAHWFYDFVSYPEQENYYSFDYGNAHFTIVDSNKADLKNIDTSDYCPGSPQYEWLKEDLKSSKCDWKFVFLHHPPYSSAER
jgi:phosphodiesterase/alkaline phosphatase D-like protein